MSSSPYSKRNHDILMKKYYASDKSQEKLGSKIDAYKQEIKALESKIRDAEKYKTCNDPCKKPFDIEMLPDKALACAKINCDLRVRREAPSLLPIIAPRPDRFETVGKLVYCSGPS